MTDYWKGYSYAIVKERDWTCEDCGKRYLYQRNKLNVHHLTYHNDNKPWQYDKDELVLLCKECHAKRHGNNIIVENQSDIQEINQVDIQEISEKNTNLFDFDGLIMFILIVIVPLIVSWIAILIATIYH